MLLLFLQQKKVRDDRDPDIILERTRREDSLAWQTFRMNASFIKEKERLFQEKYMPDSMRNIAKTLDESLAGVKSGQYGDFVVTKSPKILEREKQSESETKKE